MIRRARVVVRGVVVRRVAVVVFVSYGQLLASSCAGEPTELVPLTDRIEGLPGVGPGRARSADFTISARGGRPVTVAGAAFAGGDAEMFDGVELGWPSERANHVPPGEQMTLRFTYRCADDAEPDGSTACPSSTLVVTSDADVNPELSIAVQVDDFRAPPSLDAGVEAEDGGATVDAGA